MSKLSRTKGHSFERLIAQSLRYLFPEARRQLEYHQRDARGVDIQETGNYRIQCKRGRRYHGLQGIEEIQCDKVMGEIPILITKGDSKKIMVGMYFDDWLEMIGKLKDQDFELKDLKKHQKYLIKKNTGLNKLYVQLKLKNVIPM